MFPTRNRYSMANIPGVTPMLPPTDQYDPLQMGQRRRRGLFGRLGQAVAGNGKRDWGNVLGTIGATLQQMDGGTELSDYTAARDDQAMRRDMFGQQVRRGKLEEGEAERARAETEAAVSRLDPSMQPWARLAPEAAARSALARPEAPEYQIDAEGRPYTLQGGNVQFGEGRVAVPPRGGAASAPPSGYRFTPDGNLEAVPGGPADVRATAEGRSRIQQLDSSDRQLSNALDVLENDVGSFENGAAGFMGGVLRDVPGSSAYDLNQALEPVRSILSFENLAEMRRNSATGGALGSIAVRELELLGNTVRSLDTAQSPQQLARNLGSVRAQLRRTREAVRAARAEIDSGGAQEAPTNDGTGAPAQRILRWNPATGQVE